MSQVAMATQEAGRAEVNPPRRLNVQDEHEPNDLRMQQYKILDVERSRNLLTDDITIGEQVFVTSFKLNNNITADQLSTAMKSFTLLNEMVIDNYLSNQRAQQQRQRTSIAERMVYYEAIQFFEIQNLNDLKQLHWLLLRYEFTSINFATFMQRINDRVDDEVSFLNKYNVPQNFRTLLSNLIQSYNEARLQFH